MVVRIIMFIASIILFMLCVVLMYGDLVSNRKKIDRSIKNKRKQYGNGYQKMYR